MVTATPRSTDRAEPPTLSWEVDVDSLERWLSARTVCEGPLVVSLIQGGRSNLSYRVVDATGRQWVLRRPTGAASRSVLREGQLLTSLHETAVLAPRVAGVEGDQAVLGFPFFVMDFVEGLILRDAAGVPREWDVADKRQVTLRFVEALVRIHSTPLEALDLPATRPGSYALRQLAVWRTEWESHRSRDFPTIPSLHDALLAAVPSERSRALVHGDYRLDNVVLSSEGRVLTVLDWELSTVGDPLADLGTTIAYWADGSGTTIPPTPADAPGFPSKLAAASTYADLSGADLSDLPYFVALAHWKVACMAEGVHARIEAGEVPDGQIDADLIEKHAAFHTEHGREVLEHGIS